LKRGEDLGIEDVRIDDLPSIIYAYICINVQIAAKEVQHIVGDGNFLTIFLFQIRVIN
jgi:hypothetical protein